MDNIKSIIEDLKKVDKKDLSLYLVIEINKIADRLKILAKQLKEANSTQS